MILAILTILFLVIIIGMVYSNYPKFVPSQNTQCDSCGAPAGQCGCGASKPVPQGGSCPQCGMPKTQCGCPKKQGCAFC